jgi:hypothetical protein
MNPCPLDGMNAMINSSKNPEINKYLMTVNPNPFEFEFCRKLSLWKGLSGCREIDELPQTGQFKSFCNNKVEHFIHLFIIKIHPLNKYEMMNRKNAPIS